MEERSKRRKSTVKFQKSSRQSQSNLIHNQTTLVGSYMSLMENQKLVVAVLRYKTNDGSKIKLPVLFKVSSEQIPKDLRLLEIHRDNLIYIEIDGCKPLAAMIVSVGDDSVQLSEIYQTFINKELKSNPSSAEKKISNWLIVDNISISKFESQRLPITSEEDLTEVKKRIETLNSQVKNQSRIYQDPQPSTSAQSDLIQDDLFADDDDDDYFDESNSDLSHSLIPDQLKENDFMDNLQKLKSLNSSEVESPQDIKLIIDKVIDTFESVFYSKEMKDQQEKNIIQVEKNPGEVRYIPEEDKTYSSGQTTMIEGILPVYTNKYKAAISAKSKSEYQPAAIITNIIRFAFPKHWLVGVTVKGAGGRKSLISIWNHQNPLANPGEGQFKNGLGEKRLRALIDHVVRKGKFKKYDKATEKFLVGCLAKAMHSCRPKPNFLSSAINLDDISDPDSDIDSEIYHLNIRKKEGSKVINRSDQALRVVTRRSSRSQKQGNSPREKESVQEKVPEVKSTETNHSKGTLSTCIEKLPDHQENEDESTSGCENENQTDVSEKNGSRSAEIIEVDMGNSRESEEPEINVEPILPSLNPGSDGKVSNIVSDSEKNSPAESDSLQTSDVSINDSGNHSISPEDRSLEENTNIPTAEENTVNDPIHDESDGDSSQIGGKRTKNCDNVTKKQRSDVGDAIPLTQAIPESISDESIDCDDITEEDRVILAKLKSKGVLSKFFNRLANN
ncbi:uncharacterized protein LOC128389810 isoform X2 [Panonychus citri]|uniref:uncharacterized protein LOC128389810 isoform X2 n=1 Tax=Panonychus citri TaxID=50023 RepID=UPI0023074C2C|nr:uncharacterized protein LOC128389810 isoform X2 [Panonychus citri]